MWNFFGGSGSAAVDFKLCNCKSGPHAKIIQEDCVLRAQRIFEIFIVSVFYKTIKLERTKAVEKSKKKNFRKKEQR